MGLKQKISDSMIRNENDRIWAELTKKWKNVGFGGPMPFDERWRASKYIHALYVLQKWDERGSAAAVLSSYGIPEDVRLDVIDRYCTEDEPEAVPPAPKVKIADKYKELDQWAFDHPLEQVTPDTLTEMSGLSYASVMKYLKTTPRYKKVKNGLYEAFEDQQKVIG